MAIRDAQAGDFEAIAEITNHYILNTAIHFGYEAQTAAELRAAWEKGRGVYPFLVMEEEARADQVTPGGSPVPRVIGYAKAYRWRERAAYDRIAEVGIYLRPQLCGRGLGKTLYGALIRMCRERGFHSLIGGIALPNEPSVRLHESLGFSFTGTVREAGWKFEKWHDVGFWQMMLEK